MYRYAQILNGKVHWIFEDDMTLEEIGQTKYNLEQIQLVDITNITDAQEGYEYDGVKFIVPFIPQPTQEEIIKGYTSQVQAYLDATAKQRNYDNIFTLCGYITDPNPKFQLEAQAAVAWRSAVWTKCYEILAEVQAGTRTMPTDIISELPVMTWGD